MAASEMVMRKMRARRRPPTEKRSMERAPTKPRLEMQSVSGRVRFQREVIFGFRGSLSGDGYSSPILNDDEVQSQITTRYCSALLSEEVGIQEAIEMSQR